MNKHIDYKIQTDNTGDFNAVITYEHNEHITITAITVPFDQGEMVLPKELWKPYTREILEHIADTIMEEKNV